MLLKELLDVCLSSGLIEAIRQVDEERYLVRYKLYNDKTSNIIEADLTTYQTQIFLVGLYAGYTNGLTVAKETILKNTQI